MILLVVIQNGYVLMKGHILSLIIWQKLQERVGAYFTTWTHVRIEKLIQNKWEYRLINNLASFYRDSKANNK